jgi:hypothetical protein
LLYNPCLGIAELPINSRYISLGFPFFQNRYSVSIEEFFLEEGRSIFLCNFGTMRGGQLESDAPSPIRRVVTSNIQNPLSVEEESALLNTHTCLREIKIIVNGFLSVLEQNYRAGESQQQFNRPAVLPIFIISVPDDRGA